jgi:hypothetical protein
MIDELGMHPPEGHVGPGKSSGTLATTLKLVNRLIATGQTIDKESVAP